MFTRTMLVLCVAVLSGCPAQTPEMPAQQESVAARCQLTLGYDAWEPYQYKDIGHEVRGVDIELAEAVLEHMNCDLEFVQATWLDLLRGLEIGEIDMLVGASKTPERERYAWFSTNYRDEQFVLFVREGELHRYREMNTVETFLNEGYRLGVVNQYYYGDPVQTLTSTDAFSDQVRGAIISELNMARLIDQDVDGVLEDELVGLSMIRRKGFAEYVTPSHIEVGASPVYAMFSKETVTEAQVEAFNAALVTIHNNGTYADILARYGL
ncbi:MAG: ABC-type uptake system substrate-binding component [Idiomarinaceae bacterium HL-53]|nr:MAG: ABC-type uptake system substrate-binding component [Idiomarinaceae bacterium HL-53]CUS48472.1 polar amino acid transport system substrate-binding protein [Idiomarinaceae bacterium HL-53]